VSYRVHVAHVASVHQTPRLQEGQLLGSNRTVGLQGMSQGRRVLLGEATSARRTRSVGSIAVRRSLGSSTSRASAGRGARLGKKTSPELGLGRRRSWLGSRLSWLLGRLSLRRGLSGLGLFRDRLRFRSRGSLGFRDRRLAFRDRLLGACCRLDTTLGQSRDDRNSRNSGSNRLRCSRSAGGGGRGLGRLHRARCGRRARDVGVFSWLVLSRRSL
jgi:hypothetical protein